MKLAKSDGKGGQDRGFLQLLASNCPRSEGLSLWRLCMVLGGFAPLFGLIALRGVEAVPDRWLWVSCGLLAVVPMLFLFLRLFIVQRYEPPRILAVGQVEESRSHILTYLFATLLPFYRQDLGDTRDLIAILAAVVLIVFLFWHLNLHYVNILLAVFGYRVYTIRPKDDDDNPYTSHIPIVVITRRRSLTPEGSIRGYRLSDTLYWGIED